jgi:hypothetical protein
MELEREVQQLEEELATTTSKMSENQVVSVILTNLLNNARGVSANIRFYKGYYEPWNCVSLSA